MSKALRLTSSAALFFYAVVGVHYLRGPALATDGGCYTWGKGTYCGVNSKCVRWWTAPDGMKLCEEFEYYAVYFTTATEECVCTRGQCSCPTDPK